MRDLVLHVGTPKSGTTYLQAVLRAARPGLNRLEILYPGEKYLPKDGFNQQPAIYALAGPMIGWLTDEVRRTAAEYFERLQAEVTSARGRVLVSAESLAFFEPEAIRRLLSAFEVEPERVRVVITARDYGRLLPSVWQQNVKNGATEAVGPYLDSVAKLRGGPPSQFWTAFGLADLAERWSDVVTPERVTVVSAPRGGASDELWHRFSEVVGVPPELGTGATVPRGDDNISLTFPQAELLRQLNIVLRAEGYPRPEQQRLRSILLRSWMDRPATPGASRVPLPEHIREAVCTWAAEDLRRLVTSGVTMVGDLADLDPSTGSAPPGSVEAPVLDEVVGRDLLHVLLDTKAPRQIQLPAVRRRTWRKVLGVARATVRRPRTPPDTIDLDAATRERVR